MRRWIMWLALVVVTLGGVVAAQADYEAGQRAWDAGRHSEALREWQAAANAGDAKAMLALGRLYVQGLGAPQNYVKAHMWFNLAASRGQAEAVTERDALAARMSSEQVAEAQKLAAAWQPGESQPAASATKKPAGPPPPKAIREAQELLAALGYEPDPPEGQWSERTAQAYQAFVRDANLPVTDTLTPAALKAMRARARQAGAMTTPKPKAALPPDALHQAAKAGNLKGLEAALAAGADVNARDDKGWTALMYLVDKGYVLLVEPLLQAKADSNVRAPDGATALFMAVAHGHEEIIPLLMQAGADPTVKGPKGKTAVDVAQARYGDLTTAIKNSEPPTVIALLAGKTWADGEAFARTLQEHPPGSIFRDCAECPEMVVVPSGSYQMGSPAFEEGRNDDEGPVHRVTIAEPFAVGVYEVTRGEFERFAQETGYLSGGGDGCWFWRAESDGKFEKDSDRDWRAPGYAQTDQHPVVCVNWRDAQIYVKWLSRTTGESYRLLSEAEWEFVARGGTQTAWHWGDDETGQCRHANGFDRSTKRRYPKWKAAKCDDDAVHTSEVGKYKANAFGLFDTAGNVWEWVEDCWNENYTGAPADGSAWTSGDCGARIVRGGSWGDLPRSLRSANRFWIVSGNRDGSFGFRISNNGFRIARTLD